MTDWPMETARLTIRPGTPEDVDAVYDLRTLPEVSRWIPISSAFPREDFAALYRSPERLPWFLVVEHEGSMVGELLLKVEDSYAQVEVREAAAGTVAEIGWVIHPDHQRQGFATEAVMRLLEHCFAERGLHRVVAEAFAGNQATAGLAPRVGFRLEATHLRAALHRTEGWVDTVTYAILAEEWLTRTRDGSTATSSR
jgi:RimJ/RimL family protein N-acetyltransferase